MFAAEIPLNIEQGSTYVQKFRWKVGGEVVDLTGRAARMQVRSNYQSPSVLELNTENGRLFLGDEDGIITLDLDRFETAALAPGYYFYDLEIYTNWDGPANFDSAEVRKLCKGLITVSPEVTR